MKKNLTALSICAAIVVVAAALLAPSTHHAAFGNTSHSVTASEWMTEMR